MRKFLGLVLTGILLFCTVFSIAGCFREKSEEEIARRLIAANSKVEVPTNSEMVYLISEESNGFVHGGDFQYAVFEFESEPTGWLNRNYFEEGNYGGEAFERSFLSVLRDKPEELEEIPQEFLPNFEEEYYYLKTEDVYFVYLPQNLLLITIIPSD